MSESNAAATTTETTADATTAPATAAVAEPVAEVTTSLLDAAETAEPGDKPAADEAAPPRAAPEKYEFSLPDGVQVDSEVLGEFESVARELGMPQAEAGAILTRVLPKMQERQMAQVNAKVAEWVNSAKQEFGKSGDLEATLAHGEKFLTEFGDPELRALLKDSRIGNHPAVIRAFVKAGQAIGQDTVVTGRNAGRQPSGIEALYPSMNH